MAKRGLFIWTKTPKIFVQNWIFLLYLRIAGNHTHKVYEAIKAVNLAASLTTGKIYSSLPTGICLPTKRVGL